MGDQICAAITQADITTITNFGLGANPEWFASEDQCTAWAALFKNMPKLQELDLRLCEITGNRQATIKAALPSTCDVYGLE